MRIIEEYRESDPNQRQGSPRRELIHLICDRPRGENAHMYDEKRAAMLDDENIARDHKFCFLEIIVGDTSDFISDGLIIRGHRIGENAVLRVEATTIPNTIAAVLLWIRDTYDITPHAYLSWTEGHPLTHAARFLFFGEGETAPITREILRDLDMGEEDEANATEQGDQDQQEQDQPQEDEGDEYDGEYEGEY
jgi:hypothetical protein